MSRDLEPLLVPRQGLGDELDHHMGGFSSSHGLRCSGPVWMPKFDDMERAPVHHSTARGGIERRQANGSKDWPEKKQSMMNS